VGVHTTTITDYWKTIEKVPYEILEVNVYEEETVRKFSGNGVFPILSSLLVAILLVVMSMAFVRRIEGGIKSYEEKFRKLGDLLMQGKISEGTYESLRAEYEEKIKKLGGDIESQGETPQSK
jgi:hypothetical protein